ncbi:uncharacterized protein [Apostichopus japonicus]|uniref:uncharacterized protein n=1 Tax=Stichopus japonicus TaxID=307972 RepID=UPI003AB84197
MAFYLKERRKEQQESVSLLSANDDILSLRGTDDIADEELGGGGGGGGGGRGRGRGGGGGGGEDEDEELDKPRLPIPTTVWLIMKITCVFFQNKLAVPRECFRCHILERNKSISGSSTNEWNGCLNGDRYDYSTSERTNHYDVMQSENCTACDSYWWDYNGRVCRYADTDIGVGTWNHRGSWVVSVLLLFSISVNNAYEVITFAHFNRENTYFLVNLLSFFIFMTILSLYPIMSLYSKITTVVTQGRISRAQISWTRTLNVRYILCRLQFIEFRRGLPGKKMLLICFAWPMELFLHRFLIYSPIHICPKREGFHFSKFQTLIVTLLSMIVWTNFQYLLFLCRISFMRQFQLVQTFVKNHQGDLDGCRQMIWTVVCDFNCYRKFVYVYMMLMLPFVTWGITTSVCMQYKQGEEDIPCNNILWMIWSEHFMFLSLSLSAVGGLDVSYMWDHFRHNILTTTHTNDTAHFWRKINHHLDHMCLESCSITWTMALSFISSYMAVYSTGLQNT